MSRKSLALFFTLVLIGCDEEACRKVEEVPLTIDVSIDRLDKQLFDQKSVDGILNLLKDNNGFSIAFLDSDQYPSADIVARRLFGLIGDPFIDTLYSDTQKEYNELSDIEEELSSGFSRIKYYFPEFRSPRVQTAITGLYKDLVISDSLIVIGLDHFLGADAKYKPLDVPDYILTRYDRQHMTPIIIKFIGGWFNKSNLSDKTMLAEIVDYGKSYYFTSQVLPCVPKNIIIGYSEQEWKDANDNDGIIWANLIENELLYETDQTLKNKFIGERPNIFEIGERCPGRIGRWVGWQIVDQYMRETPDVTLQELMAESDANKIFQRSKYKPKN